MLCCLLALLAGRAFGDGGPCPGAAAGDPAALAAAAFAALGETPPDTTLAVSCLQAAAAVGDPGARVALGHLAAAGLDGPVDLTRAAAAFSQAAGAGSPQGRLAMGLAFARGDGVPAEPYWAYWFCRRAELEGGLTAAEAALAAATAAAALPRLEPHERRALDAGLTPGSVP